MIHLRLYILSLLFLLLASCSTDSEDLTDQQEDSDDTIEDTNVLQNVFGADFSMDNLPDYANQAIPDYIEQDNTGNNTITDEKAMLGRILFYDRNLSVDNTISCSSCHQQAFAFGDLDMVSTGVNGVTGRHSMRLINSRFARESRFFWDERANSLEEQTTQPIQDHAEMGFSGQDGGPDLTDLFAKLEAIDYYQELFQVIYGDTNVTEARLQESMAQFIRSIQSFDSKFDLGRAMVNADNANFPNYTDQENQGKTLFFQPPNIGGAGCITCHSAPEFDIDPESLNNGVVGIFGDAVAQDETVTRAPTLRDIFDANGNLNGPLMHDASLTTFRAVLEHYNDIDATANGNLDNRLRGGQGGNGQNLNLSADAMDAIEAFIKTLSGNDVYSNEKWSDPFVN